MDFWNDAVTEKSWNILQELGRAGFDFVLIGGWAVYFFTKGNKSKDINIIVDFDALEKLKLKYALKKNDSLKKFEITIDEIDVDIYVPYYSKLALPAEEILKHTLRTEGFNVVRPEVLLILKQSAELDRGESEKGLKDRIDILNLLLNYPVDFKLYREIVDNFGLSGYRERLKKIVAGFKEVKYIGLNLRELKLKKTEILGKL